MLSVNARIYFVAGQYWPEKKKQTAKEYKQCLFISILSSESIEISLYDNHHFSLSSKIIIRYLYTEITIMKKKLLFSALFSLLCTPAHVCALTPAIVPKCDINRKTILQAELINEQKALAEAQQALNRSRTGKGSDTTELQNMVLDRQINIQALQRELSRMKRGCNPNHIGK